MSDVNAVGVNLLWLTPGVVGGSEEYTVRLLRAAAEVNQQRLPRRRLSVRLYTNPDLLAVYPDLAERFDVRSLPMLAVSSAQKSKRILAEHSWLTACSRSDSVVHHAGGTIPFVRSSTPILTIHDLQPLEYPENFSLPKRHWLQTMLPRSARAARIVVCPSQFTADRVVKLLGVTADRTTVVAHGHQPVAPRTDATRSDSARQNFGRFLLYPAITYPHKRHKDILKALKQLDNAFADVTVVFTGGDGPELANLRKQARELDIAERVNFAGRVLETELDELYRAAALTVIPSSYEGFGNPALEAMARGCPLIVADAAALPEVVGEAALKVPVGNIDAWVGAIQKVLGDADTAAALRNAGLERAKRYDWESAGAALLDVYDAAQRQYLRSSGD